MAEVSSIKNSNGSHVALVLSGGSGKRYGGLKQFELLKDKIILEYSVEAFARDSRFSQVAVICRAQDLERTQAHFSQAPYFKKLRWVRGGKTRAQSVWNGLLALEDLPLKETTLWVHDGARPGLDEEILNQFFEFLKPQFGLIPTLPLSDTIKQAKDGNILGTLDRNILRRAQTPQVFPGSILFESYFQARQNGFDATDDSSVVEKFSECTVKEIEGSQLLRKVTTPEDIALLEKVMDFSNQKIQLNQVNTPHSQTFKMGLGYDLHRLEMGRKFILAGVEISHPTGPVGHSDADVLTHAVIDSLLGALSMKDIGSHFPDTDPKYKDCDSLKLLEITVGWMKERGYSLHHMDANIHCEKPKLGPHMDQMKKNLCHHFNCSQDHINLKAKTGEGVGPIGEQKAIECQVLIQIKKENTL